MKKLTITLLMTAALLGLSACGKEENEPQKDTSTKVQTEDSELSSGQNGTEADGDGETEGYREITLEDVLNHAETPAEDFDVSSDGSGGVWIDEYIGTDPIIVIPEEIDGKKVTSVGKLSESPNTPVYGVRYADSVESISAFSLGDDNIQYVICGAGLKSIPDGCFYYCENLKEVQLNEGLEIIGNKAFATCRRLGDLYIPASVTELGWETSFGSLDSCTLHVVSGSNAESYCSEKIQEGYELFPNWVAE